MSSQINLSPINQFIHQIRSAELANQKELRLTIQQARLISLSLTELMNSLFEKKSIQQDSTVIKINMDGGGFE